MADFNNTNLADFSGVWVFCEQRQGELQPTVLELISEARKLADDMGTEVCGLLLGGKGVGEKMAKELGAYGADKVLVCESDLLSLLQSDLHVIRYRLPYTVSKSGDLVSVISSFLISVLASVAAYCICKWLDGKM